MDLTKIPVVGKLIDRILSWRIFQFLVILPNQLLFWLVLITGIVGGTVLPQSVKTKAVNFGNAAKASTHAVNGFFGAGGGGTTGAKAVAVAAAHPSWAFNTTLVDTWSRLNFSTVITWWLWWSLVWLLMAGVGRGWCMVCPFGGFAEWVQRGALWKRKRRSIGLNLRWPRSLIRWGILPSVAAFIILTFIEEYYNISASADPFTTGLLVIAIIALALIMHLVFERRTFCAYLCPLTAVFAPLGTVGMSARFHARDFDRCNTCPTKECLRGGVDGYECPWYDWPGNTSSTTMCGLCSECYKACPYDNVGLYVQPPLSAVIAPGKRRIDIALALIFGFGVITFMTVNATLWYTSLDQWLDSHTPFFTRYPNPVDYFGIVFATALVVGIGIVGVRLVAGSTLLPAAVATERTIIKITGVIKRWIKDWLVPLSYAAIPLVTADLIANRTPTFLFYVPRIIQVISDPFGRNWNIFGTAHLRVVRSHLVSFSPIGLSGSALLIQLVIMGIGTLVSLWSMHRIYNNELLMLSSRPLAGRVASLVFILVIGAVTSWFYFQIGGLAT